MVLIQVAASRSGFMGGLSFHSFGLRSSRDVCWFRFDWARAASSFWRLALRARRFAFLLTVVRRFWLRRWLACAGHTEAPAWRDYDGRFETFRACRRVRKGIGQDMLAASPLLACSAFKQKGAKY